MALEPTQSLTKMSTKNLSGNKGRPALKADNFPAICEPTVAALTSEISMDLGLLQG
jgi:hypothetical protein